MSVHVCVVYHIFFIHSSLVGLLDWFHVLAIASSTATNKGVLCLCGMLTWIPFGLYPGVLFPSPSMVKGLTAAL